MNALEQKHVATRRLLTGYCLIQIDDLDPIAIGVVKIGVPARERGVALVGIFDEFDATRLHDCKRPIEFLRRYHESMMMSVLTAKGRDLGPIVRAMREWGRKYAR